MKLHIFNPGHEIALAEHRKYVTLPHAARQLQHDLSFLPTLWADNGDLVLVESKAHQDIPSYLKKYAAKVSLIDDEDLPYLDLENTEIMPWGWNLALQNRLLERSRGRLSPLLPSQTQLEAYRTLCSRGWCATHLLPHLVANLADAVGIAHAFSSDVALFAHLKATDNGPFRQYVLKAPWSSSGRGLRYVDMQREGITPHLQGWVANVIAKQGYIMAEPYYNKVFDFGMEFHAHKNGSVDYLGLSVFHTVNGAYAGNLLANESDKQELVSRYASSSVLKTLCDAVKHFMPAQLQGIYAGPFGIDMMIVGEGKIHPCVELNLRRTMGHVALSLSAKQHSRRSMQIAYKNGRYSLHINPLSHQSV